MSLEKPPSSEDSSAPPPPANIPVWKPAPELPSKDSSAQSSPASPPRWQPTSEPSIEADGKNQSEKRPVSMRKVEANRRNALKSTGPRTPKGKEYTGRNAVKHGLLASHISDFRALDEDPQEFEDLLNGLWDSLQPVGRAEEEEVENMALCRWKQKRAWRYENAVNLVARRKLDTEKLPLQIAYCQKQGQEEAAVILLLQGMQKEIEDAGQISQALKQQIFALMPGLEGIWLAFDKDAQERAKVLDAPEKFENLSSQTRSLIVASATVTNLIAFVENLSKRRWSDLKEVTIGLEAIPGGVPLDCLLRYGAGNDRSFDRSLHRFERLRRLRREERIPRSKSLRWTQ